MNLTFHFVDIESLWSRHATEIRVSWIAWSFQQGICCIFIFLQTTIQATLFEVHFNGELQRFGFVDMDSLVQVNLHFSLELWWFWSGHGLDMASQGSIRVTKIRILWIHDSFKFAESLPKRTQVRIWWSGTQKCSQRIEIDHFCEGKCSALQPSKSCYESNRGSFRFTHSISDIPMTPSCSLRSFGIGGWCHVSCISIQILKFTVQA